MTKLDKFIALTPEEIEKLTPAEKEARAAELVAQLDALRPSPPPGARPGTKIGDGLTMEYVPFTKEFYLDVEARKADREKDGTPTYAGGYELHSVIANKTQDIFVNGVGFKVIAGRPCKLPTPHYLAYMDSIRQLQKLEEDFAPPANAPVQAGYVSPPHRMPGVWSKAPIE